ncbi:cytochrome c [Acuticoccus sp. M5D2P5]|uniref:c-type cytochrome n=1 Tax=Acuticoccus kalidii TaxID=2910977 RepID=UPI001F37B2E8|nr:cytochrome c [Acuticoccus kalidii]MCF3936191.1 cytochrome c [Acuticoccus kalidii]
MRTLFALVLVLLAGAAAGYIALAVWPIGPSGSIDASLEGDPQRGAYLARTSGCISCHTDFSAGGAPLAGGPALDTPFGVFHAPNITTDPEVGIGAWTLADFDRAVRGGVSPDGEPLYPVFPYEFYAGLTDQEVADLFAAFQTVAPVAEAAPAHVLDFPFSLRPTLKVWRALYFRPDEGAATTVAGADAAASEPAARGRHLVESVVHCGACHTPRNMLGGLDAAAPFEGSDMLPGGDVAPAITPAALAQDGWSIESLAYALKSGITPSGDAFGGEMAEFVKQATAFLSDDDRTAIATYLMERPGRP